MRPQQVFSSDNDVLQIAEPGAVAMLVKYGCLPSLIYKFGCVSALLVAIVFVGLVAKCNGPGPQIKPEKDFSNPAH